MIKGIVDDLTIKAEKNMNKIFHNPTVSAYYSLSNELTEIENELDVLEKKINLGNNLLIKVEEETLISKLKKQNESYEVEKNNLNSAITKIKYINGSIKDFTLFFIFLRRFYTLAILKQNYENVDKKNSTKLIDKLKIEEENLYKEYVDGSCFSNVLLALDFKRYQPYFKEFAKNFFENINTISDPFINALLILKAVFFECSYFIRDDFNLTDLKFFLSKNIPINIPLPESNYELVALRCFFFYELLLEFLTLKPIMTHSEDLKKAIILDLAIIDYKANTKDTLIFSLNNLKESLTKIDNKHNSFLRSKPVMDREADVNHALVFYKELEDEIQIINKKSRALIDNKYLKLEKMQQLLTLIVDEKNIPKFVEVFNRKIGNDFSLNIIENPNITGTNKEALSYLFHALCKEKFYISINEKINNFIKELPIKYSKIDAIIFDNLEFEDLVEFSFYYIFTLLYSDFNAYLSGFNRKLSYTEMATSNVFFNIKFQSLGILITKRKDEIKKFLEKKFKNITEYNLYKKNILEEIKLSLETIKDLNSSLSEVKSLNASLVPELKNSKIPMPGEDLILESLKSLEEKQRDCEAEYQEIEKHEFIQKSKLKKLTRNTEEEFKKKLEIENNKPIQDLTETLNCLSENLSESLKHIEETKQDVNLIFQRISSAMNQVSISVINCLSNLNGLHTDSTQNLKKLNLSELLKLVEDFLIENTLIKEDFKDKLIALISNFRLLITNLVDQVSLITDKYSNCNSEMEKILNSLPVSNHSPSQFFSNSLIKQIKPKTKELFKVYIHLKDQLNFLKKIINLFKCDTDGIRESYNIIKKLDNSYQNAYKLLNKKMRSQNGVKDKNCEKNDNKISPQSLDIKEDLEKVPEKNIEEKQSEKFNQDIEKPSSSQHSQTSNSREHSLLTEIVKSTVECTKIKARLEGEYANKERAKANLRAIIADKQYEDLMGRVDPLDIGRPTTIENVDNNQFQTDLTSNLNASSPLQIDTLETNPCNHSQSGDMVYATPVPIMFFPAPPLIVVDTYRLESRTVFYPIQ